MKTCRKCRKEKALSQFYRKLKVHTAQCKDCTNEYWRIPKNAERKRRISSQWQKDHPERNREHARKSYHKLVSTEAGREKRREWARTYYKEYCQRPEVKRAFAERRRKYQIEWSKKGEYRMNNSISANVWASLKGTKKGRKWQSLVQYSLSDLKDHLEALFLPEMTFDNYGEWHIDHIVPKTRFKFDSPEDPAFTACWALSNLMPRWATTKIAQRHDSSQLGNINKGVRDA